MGLLKETAHEYYSGNDLGSYQFISLEHIINNFMIAYVGEGKIIPKIKRTDVLFHARRALQELSYDTFKSIKSQEITLPPSLVMPLPQDYVNYVKITWSDGSGVEHVMYPNSKTSNPNTMAQDSDGNYMFQYDDTAPDGTFKFPLELTIEEIVAGQSNFPISAHILGFKDIDSNGFTNNPDTIPVRVGMEIVSPYFPAGTTITAVYDQSSAQDWTFDTSNASLATMSTQTNVVVNVFDKSETWDNYEDNTLSEANDDYEDDIYWPNVGGRHGLDPQHAHVNGSFYIDNSRGKIHFSSNINGKNIILKYISDSLGTDAEMQVHKFAEEAMYKNIAYAIASTTLNGQAIAPTLKRERFAETRKAKIRLSNLKIEELTQIMRGKSKFIKH